MQDAKTGGSRWVPDIREDEITEFQEQNGEETATYKAVNVHPIISRVLDKLAFFRTHVSAVWYNKLANKTVKDKLDEIDTSINSLNSSNLNVDITPASGISSVYEYFRYSTIGNLCIVDIGGIIFSAAGLAQEATGSDIPMAKTRPIGILSTDPTEISQPGNTTLMYGSINNTYLVCHVPPGMEGKKLYGQIVYAIS